MQGGHLRAGRPPASFPLLLCLSCLCLVSWAAPPRFTITNKQHGPYSFQIFRLKEGDSEPKMLTATQAQNFNAKVSRDGRLLAFTTDRDNQFELYVCDLENDPQLQHPIRLTVSTPFVENSLTWAPDNKAFAFVSTRDYQWEMNNGGIYVQKFDAQNLKLIGDAKRVSPYTATDISPHWHTDGLIYAAWAGFRVEHANNKPMWPPAFGYMHSNIIRMKPDGTNRETVVPNAGWPAMAGDRLYFHRFDQVDQHWGVFKLVLNFSSPTPWIPERVSPLGLDVVTPAVSADGLVLVAAEYMPPTLPGSGYRRLVRILPGRKLQLYPLGKAAGAGMWNPTVDSTGSTIWYHSAGYPENPSTLPPNTRIWEVPNDLPVDIDFRIVRGAFPHISPDGSKIAVSRERWNKSENAQSTLRDVDVMDADGTNRKTIYKGKAWMTSWNPKSGTIFSTSGDAFASHLDANVQVIEMNPDGSNVHNVTDYKLGVNNGFADVHPKGDKIVFRSGYGAVNTNPSWLDSGALPGNRTLWTINTDGSGMQRVTTAIGDSADNHPAFHPSGEKIVFASTRGISDTLGIHEVFLNGSGVRQLFWSERAISVHPAYSPDGEWIVFSTSAGDTHWDVISFPAIFEVNNEVFMMPARGVQRPSDLIRLTHDFVTNCHQFWSTHKLPQPSNEPGTTDVGNHVIGDSIWAIQRYDGLPAGEEEAQGEPKKARAKCPFMASAGKFGRQLTEEEWKRLHPGM